VQLQASCVCNPGDGRSSAYTSETSSKRYPLPICQMCGRVTLLLARIPDTSRIDKTGLVHEDMAKSKQSIVSPLNTRMGVQNIPKSVNIPGSARDHGYKLYISRFKRQDYVSHKCRQPRWMRDSCSREYIDSPSLRPYNDLHLLYHIKLSQHEQVSGEPQNCESSNQPLRHYNVGIVISTT
jgi:hypothetical protein